MLARDDPADTVTWTAPASGNTLDWGTLKHFEFTASVAPAAAPVTLIGAATSTEAEPPYPRVLLGSAVPNHVVSAD